MGGKATLQLTFSPPACGVIWHLGQNHIPTRGTCCLQCAKNTRGRCGYFLLVVVAGIRYNNSPIVFLVMSLKTQAAGPLKRYNYLPLLQSHLHFQGHNRIATFGLSNVINIEDPDIRQQGHVS